VKEKVSPEGISNGTKKEVKEREKRDEGEP
jgi:hypothetical protein